MPSEEVAHVLGIVRRMDGRRPLGEEDERAVVEFLSRAAQRPIPSTVAAELAQAVAESGSPFPTEKLSPLTTVHSTGAPGSLSTLLSPVLAAACGFHVPLVSVRGSVAGAIDSLEALPGYNTCLDAVDFVRVLRSARLAHNEHSPDFAPADRVLWELRGRSGAKEVPALIAVSLLGKKLAAGVHCGAIDVRIGPAGNAGSTPNAALETAWAVVSTAQLLGMRFSCVLSDANRLPWPHLGRIDSLLSLWEVLTVDTWQSHAHVRLCLEVAAAACHAANPLIEAGVWLNRAEEALRSGRARETFDAAIQGHGVRNEAIDQVRRLAATRSDVAIPLDGEPEPRSVSEFFKAARALMSPENADILGMSWKSEERLLVAHVPAGEDHSAVGELVAAIRPLGEATPPGTTHVRFNGDVVRGGP